MNAARSVTATFSVTPGALTYTAGTLALNRTTGRYRQAITITNHGAAVSNAAFVTDGLTPGVTLYQASGVTSAALPSGSPYLNVGPIGADGTLAMTIEFALELLLDDHVHRPGPRRRAAVGGSGARQHP